MSEDTTLAPEVAHKSALDRVADAVIAVAATALFGLVIVQGWQVFARYVINDSPSWTEPVTLLLLSTAMSLGAAVGVHTNRHFGFFLLQEHMRPAIRRVVELLVPLVIVAIGAVIAWWATILLFDGLGIKAAGANLPQSINYLPLAIGGALMVLFALNHFVRVLRPAPAGEGH
ncbi:TRAP transporter small permease [Luteimonas terrae]|uniref:TRAP transporter small permease protein n=1 Tax=Luteimonas terrae TaxID=1530191 RepID=A0ABU1XZW7_9GAMM|nr:TRAP transporter small permease [Luteimonas terrae]MDR7194313.1 TRAP-type C4-dicarboxylate transport system permease small subunit [Luteimonas terrae]